jgi:hypothetical protein
LRHQFVGAQNAQIGLLAPLERKNGWQLAEAAGDTSPDKMQRVLASARQDCRLVREDLQGYVAGHLGEPMGWLLPRDLADVSPCS